MKDMKRNYGIDFARILAMYLVVVWHYVEFGGMLSNVSSEKVFCGKLFSSFAICAVDLFALITGYVGAVHTHRWRRFGKLWLQVWVTGLVSLGVAVSFFGAHAGLHELVRALLPVMRCEYWYFTAYAGVFLLMPFLNAGLRTVPKREASLLLFVLLALASFAGLVLKMDFLYLNNGYSIWWLLICYLLGGFIRLHVNVEKIPLHLLILAGVLSYAVTYLNSVLPYPNGRKPFFCYTSPTVLLMAMSLMLLFAKMRISRGGGGTYISSFATCIRGVSLACTASYVESGVVGCIRRFGKVSNTPLCFVLPWRTTVGVRRTLDD